MDDNHERKLIRTYPGMPSGAGIYDDGKFYNCAPGEPAQVIPHEWDLFYSLHPDTGMLLFDKGHPDYKSTRDGLRLAGIDIDTLMSEDVLEEYIHEYRELIYEAITSKWLTRNPVTLYQKKCHAFARGDRAEAVRLQHIIERQQALGLSVLEGQGGDCHPQGSDSE